MCLSIFFKRHKILKKGVKLTSCLKYVLDWEQILKLSRRILIGMVYLGSSEECFLPQPYRRCLTQLGWECGFKGESSVQGMIMDSFQKTVYKGTLGKFLFTSFCHIIKNSYQLKWRKPISSRSMKIKMNLFFFFSVLAQHFHWSFFEVSNIWFRIFDILMDFKKNTNLCWYDFPFVF